MPLFRRWRPTPIEELLDPAAAGLRNLSDDALAEYISGWKPSTKQRVLAEAELRRRERWSGPVRLSLIVSVVALALSLAGLIWG